MGRELLLYRHAEAGAGSRTGRDYDRVLTDYGRTQPEPTGRALLSAGFSPQLVLCSASVRTRETLALLQGSGLAADTPVQFSEGLYECTTRQIMSELASVDESIARVLLVGHNPGLSDLATALTHKGVGLSPGDYVWLCFDHEWHAIDSGPVTLKS